LSRLSADAACGGRSRRESRPIRISQKQLFCMPRETVSKGALIVFFREDNITLQGVLQNACLRVFQHPLFFTARRSAGRHSQHMNGSVLQQRSLLRQQP
jgi:hypothetical protein